jgi:hypothetical protein
MGNLIEGLNTDSTSADGFRMKPTADEQAALDLVYDGPKALPADPGSLYSTAGYLRHTFDTNFRELSDAGVLTPGQQAAERTDYSALIRGTGLDPLHVGRPLHDLWTAARLAEARGEPGPSDAQVQTWNEQNLADLRIRYGAAAGDQLLERTRTWVRREPALAKVLKQHGLGSRPDIVEKLVAHVFSNGIV